MSSMETKQLRNEAGQLLGEIELRNGVPHGNTRHYDTDGELVLASHYVDGVLHGKYQSWWSNGKPKELGEYANGERVGRYRWFDQSGVLRQEHSYE